MGFKKIIKDAVTENDGESWDIVRLFGAALAAPSIIIFISGYAVDIYHGHFNGVEFAQSFGFMMAGLAALGGGIAMKSYNDNRN